MVPIDVFLLCLDFFTSGSTYFAFNEEVFKQCKGLAMGNRLAQVLAEIRTNHSLLLIVREFSADTISFIYKYVDDILSSMHNDFIQKIKEKMSCDVGMELTLTEENQNQEVEFLDCKFKRNTNNSISFRWFKKEYSSLSILNYHSHHPWSMKRNVVLEMIRKAFSLTSIEFINDVKENLSNILERSSYPELFIIENINVFPWDGVQKIQSVMINKKFVSCPFTNPIFEETSFIVKDKGLGINLAPKPYANNKRVLFSRTKDSRPTGTMRNAIFKIKCKNCEFQSTMTTARNLDVERTYQRLVNNGNSSLSTHLRNFPDHSFNANAEIVKSFFNCWDLEHSEWILNDIKKIKRG